MKTVSIHEAKTHLSRLIQLAMEGEEVIIARRNDPMVKLQVVRKAAPVRRFGGLKKMVLAMGPSFDEPLADFAESSQGRACRGNQVTGTHVKLLLDTQAILWMVSDDPRLPLQRGHG